MNKNKCKVTNCRKWSFFLNTCKLHLVQEIGKIPVDFELERLGDSPLSNDDLIKIASSSNEVVIFNGDEITPFLRRFNVLPGTMRVPAKVIYRKYIQWCLLNKRNILHQKPFFLKFNSKFETVLILSHKYALLKEGTFNVNHSDYSMDQITNEHNFRRRKRDAKKRELSRKRRAAKTARNKENKSQET